MRKRSKSSVANSVVSECLRPGLRANIRLWMYAPGSAGVFGDGKCRILEAIDAHGSLFAAAKDIGMSYRKAWADLRKAEDCLGIRLLTRKRGGRTGGATALTNDARAVLSAYREFRQEVTNGVKTAFARFVERTNRTVASKQ